MTQCDANGNTFLVMEQEEDTISPTLWFQNHTCSEDGVIWLFEKKNQWHMEYFNCDGSRAAMCGNGARSAYYYLYKNNKISSDQWTSLKTSSGEIHGFVDSSGIPTVSMPPPILFRSLIWKGVLVDVIKVGVPHVAQHIKTRKELDSFPLHEFFTAIRMHDLIPPESNADIFYYEDNHIWLRTFENGVNRETKSCGTGCVAVSYLLKNTLNSNHNEWTAHTKGGDVSVSIDANLYYLKGQVICNDAI
ncbi:MAG: diaminopimelate epimerase [Caldisericia bacterium]|nr:diaminopimelate epimerase [Caldisericia bacterium]MDD4615174.1 diaminopimelate epimerase [Caldisericia bacterium]